MIYDSDGFEGGPHSYRTMSVTPLDTVRNENGVTKNCQIAKTHTGEKSN